MSDIIMGDTILDFKTEEDTKQTPQKLTHIVSPPENTRLFAILSQFMGKFVSAKDIVDYARRHGHPVTALCGYTWVPQDDPDAYDACQICMDVAGMHMRNAGE